MMKITKKGFEVLRDKTLNRSIAFTREERERLGLRGLLPHAVATSGANGGTGHGSPKTAIR